MEASAARPSGVAIRYFDGCPSWRTAFHRLNEVLAEAGHDDIPVVLERIETPEDAERLRFIGSPTILLDGVDPFSGQAGAESGLSCRVYRTPEGLSGSPTKDQFREVLARLDG